MKNGWLVYSAADAKKNAWYVDHFISIAKKKDMQLCLVLREEIAIGASERGLFLKVRGQVIEEKPDFVICRTIYPLLSNQFQAMGIRTFNCGDTAQICNDKAKTIQRVAASGIPVAPTQFVAAGTMPAALKDAQYPLVAKTVDGHGGSEVFLLEGPPDDTLLALFDHRDAVIQRNMEEFRQDLRVYVLDNQIVAAVLRKAEKGFKANFSLGGSVSLYELSDRERELVRSVCELFSLDLAGIDFLRNEAGDLLFSEIEDVVGARMLYQCSDLDIVELYLDYIAGDSHAPHVGNYHNK